MTKELFIIDTDTGVDDAMAILQMLAAKKKGRVDLLCITAVNGNCSCEDAIRNICRVLDTARVDDVPVYRGATEPLVVPFDNQGKYHGSDGFNDVEFPALPDTARVKDGYAWNVISELTKKYPNEITLIALGPLTNVALAMKADPGLPTRLKQISIMGGNIEGFGNVTPSAEYNFYVDPEAASVVLQQTKCPTYISSWELSLKYTLIRRSWRDQVLGKLTSPAANLINKLEQVWFDNWPWGENWILCDQLAVAPAIDKQMIKRSSEHYAQVELGKGLTRGMMVLDQRQREGRHPKSNVIVIEELDHDMVQQQLFDAFSL